MVGYPEALTDPSYNGQILTLTYPLVGNYGVPDSSVTDQNNIPKFFESNRIQARGLVIHELSKTASHWNMSITLDEWLHREGIPGISNIDTRHLTQKLREGGVMMAAITVSDSPIDIPDILQQLGSTPPYSSESFMNAVSVSEPKVYGKTDSKSIVVIDTGAKYAIIRNVLRLGYKAVVLPWNTTYDKVMSYHPDGVVFSSGPGDPQACLDTIQTAKQLINDDIPTLGICLGAQIIGLAGGATTYKLKYGHRGQNKPCVDLDTGNVYITSQNHGYGISPESLVGTDFDLWFTNADDNTVEGIKHKTNKCIAVQFHPEAAPGPYDCHFIFDILKRMINDTN